MRKRFLVAVLLCVMIVLPSMPVANSVSAQEGPCGTVDSLSYPLNPEDFSARYAYGVTSGRYNGRFHAGEDWFGSRSTTYGTAVHAIGKGRVTYAEPLGWGTDKGVVIIEHLMPDGTWLYSMYGHMEEVNGYEFPTVYTCVDEGDIIGAIGRPNPGPHLHFEIRNHSSDAPGPGYWSTDPDYSGWQDPSKFIANWQGWVDPAHLWHTVIAEESGPTYPGIIRDDGMVIVYDDDRLKGITDHGGVLWRYIMPEELDVVAMLPYEDHVLVVDRSGIAQLWSMENGYLDQWQLPHEGSTSSAFIWNNLLLTHAGGDTLIAYGPDRVERWRVSGVPRPVEVKSTASMLGVMSAQNTLTFVGVEGDVLSQSVLRETGNMAQAPDDGFYVRTETALWMVDVNGEWHRLSDAPPVQRSASTMHSLPDGRFFLYDGPRGQTLYAYDVSGTLLWESVVSSSYAEPFLSSPEDDGPLLLVTPADGAITLMDADTGEQCAAINVWASDRSASWAGLGADGVLRVHLADQIAGLDWDTFAGNCQ